MKLLFFDMKPKNIRFFLVGSLLFLIFLFISLLAADNFFGSIDFWATSGLQNLFSRSVDLPFSILSLLGNIEPTTTLLLIVSVLFLRKFRRIPYSLFALFFTLSIFEILGKYFLYHPPPPDYLVRYFLPFSFPAVHLESAFSFPSGHVSRILYLTVISLFLVSKFNIKTNNRRLIYVGGVLFAVLMIISRIYLGEHWFSDTLGGLFLGTGMGFLALIYY